VAGQPALGLLQRSMAGSAREINGSFLPLSAKSVHLPQRIFGHSGHPSAFRRLWSPPMAAMHPVWEFFNRLEGFEFAAFWIASFTGVVMSGFFIDYLMQRQGFGPMFNGLYVLGGVWLGLYLRFNYFLPNKVHFNDPFLTISCIFGVTSVLLVVMAFVRNRTS
jgi:hypothetical protein